MDDKRNMSAVKFHLEDSLKSRSLKDVVPAIWNVGDLLLDEYEVTDKLGEGGMGTVYKIHDRRQNIDMVVKNPRPEIFTRTDGKENFIHEAEVWMKLRWFPHLVMCFYVITLGDIPRIFAEYVDGGSLADWIRQRKLYQGDSEQALARILDIAIQFAWGLYAAHEQGLVHQDVKPANVMLTSQGIAKVTDFGLAKARVMAGEQDRQDANRSILVSSHGMTPAYCSPEQAAGQALSLKTDIWSWGLSVLEMFVGEVTWTIGVVAQEALASSDKQKSAIIEMPAEVVKLLNRCFQLQPEKRPGTMLEVATELQAIYTSLLRHPYPYEIPEYAEVEADTLNNQGLALYELGKSKEALVVYGQAIRLDPTFAIAYHNAGLALKQLGRRGEALAAYEQAIHLDSTLADAYNEKGLVLKDLGRLEEALAAYWQAIRLNPTFAYAYHNKGNVLLQQGRLQEALAAYEQAIRLAPTYGIAYYSKGGVLLQQGRLQEARGLFKQAVAFDPSLATTIDKALSSYDQVMRPKPTLALADSYYVKGVMLIHQRRLEEALISLQLAIGLNPTLAPAHCTKGAALLMQGKPEEALVALEQAIRLDPAFAEAYYHKGRALLQLGRLLETRDAFKRASELDPTYSE